MADAPRLKVAYTIPELAKMAGISRWKMARLLEANGVKLHKAGAKKRTVLLSQIRQCFPDLWDSLLDVMRLA